MNLTQIKTLIDKTSVKSKDAAILLIYAIENGLNPACVFITETDVKALRKSNLVYVNKAGKLAINFKEIELDIAQKDVDTYLDEYRQLWKGLFTGSMGTPDACKSKLEEWLAQNPQYTMKDIIKAAKFWIDNKTKEVDNPNLIGQADYFVFKKVDGVQQSRLSSVIEEAKDYNAGSDVFSTFI